MITKLPARRCRCSRLSSAAVTVRMGVGERRARLGVRHRLAARSTVAEVASDLISLHATDVASVFLACAARTDAAPGDVEQALYDDRSLVRMPGMRRTMWVVDRHTAPLVQASSTTDIAVRERKKLVKDLTVEGVENADAWLTDVEAATLRALTERGTAMASELTGDVPPLRTTITGGRGKPYESTTYITSRVLAQISFEGRIFRGRPRGSWVSTQYEWAPTSTWLGAGLPVVEAGTARHEIARRWLRTFGPATLDDVVWWTGWTKTQVTRAVAGLDTVEVDLDGASGLVLADDVEPVAEPEPWAALLPALDPTAMGWKHRDWYVGDHTADLFDRSGNIGPTVWCDGRVVGVWGQLDGHVVHRLFEDVGTESRALIDAEAARLTGWCADVRLTPKFRTPAERALADS